MLNRQKIALEMLRARGGRADRLHVTKWLFLLSRETGSRGGNAFYQFVPYKYGPYSFSLYHEFSNLARDGLVIEGSSPSRWWELTPIGMEESWGLPEALSGDIDSILNRYGPMDTTSLVDSVYSQHPWFTLLTVLRGRRAVERPRVRPAIYTMGYEGLAVDGFLNRLLETGIQRVIDVRNNPTSRRYGFHRSTLSRLTRYVGVEYQHLPNLGIPSRDRSRLNGAGADEALLDDYSTNILPTNMNSIELLARDMADKPSVLLCMEADPLACHRSRLAEATASIAGLPVIHLER